MYGDWQPYVPVAERRRQAAAAMRRLAGKGHQAAPVEITGRAIATTAWGKAWCTNIERYSDYANRLPRGRTYVRNGSVVDLRIVAGAVEALVSGSSLYRTTVTVKPLAASTWKQLCADCAGGIDSLVELLQGRFAAAVMERLCRHGDGLFPIARDIRFTCSCPDGAWMCKHVAAVLYGIGARFDRQPELLFTLRQVDPSALLAKAGAGLAAAGPVSARTLVVDDLGALFGVELDSGSLETATSAVPGKRATAQDPGKAPHQKPVRPKPRSLPVASGPLPPSEALLRHLRSHGSLDNATARTVTGMDSIAVRRLLQRLVEEGRARVEGSRRGTRYLLS
jgi:uncharacterized Zn finger protein